MVTNTDQYSKLRERTKSYAHRIIRLYGYIQKRHHFDSAAIILGKQMLRSGTSVAANHREAKHARSQADLNSKINIILQELEETLLWLELLADHQMVDPASLVPIITETNELISIFIASSRKLKTH
jgi:four helix bundle protein